jgi:RHS repeat-associated protein
MKRVQQKRVILLALAIPLVTGTANAEVTYFHHDALGSTVAATVESGTVLWREAYQPYGERLDKAVSTDEHSTYYTGKPHGDRTGLTYFGARYYDPVIGRFMGVDPVGVDPSNTHSFNRYAYVNNNPYRYVDPDGREVIDASGSPIIANQIATIKNDKLLKGVYELAHAHDRKITIKLWKDAPGKLKKISKTPAATQAVDPAGSKTKGVGSDSYIYIDPSDPFKVRTTHGEVDSPLDIVIWHELLHGYDNAQGENVTVHDPNYGVSISERRVRHKENKIRRQRGVPLRKGDGARGRIF